MSELKVAESAIHFEPDGMDELRQRFEHLQRVKRRESATRMRSHAPHQLAGSSSGGYTPSQLQRLQKCFNMADHDLDGKLNGMELSYWLEKHDCPLGHIKLASLLRVADTDGDGALSFQEFVAFCQKIELEEGDEDQETFYDCLEDIPSVDLAPHTHHMKHSHRPSLQSLEEHHLASQGAHAFENQIRSCADGACVLERDPAEYEARVQHVRESAEGFDISQLRGILRHPLHELGKICSKEMNKEGSHHHGHKEREGSSHHRHSDHTHSHHEHEEERFRTELSITLTQEGQPDESVLDDDGASVIVPMHPDSREKFDHDHDEGDHNHNRRRSSQHEDRRSSQHIDHENSHHAGHRSSQHIDNGSSHHAGHRSSQHVDHENSHHAGHRSSQHIDHENSHHAGHRSSQHIGHPSSQHAGHRSSQHIDHQSSHHVKKDASVGVDNLGGVDVEVQVKEELDDTYENFYGTHHPPEMAVDNFEALQLAEAGWDPDLSHWE